MRKSQRKNSRKVKSEKLLLATAIISLIKAIIELIEKLVD